MMDTNKYILALKTILIEEKKLPIIVKSKGPTFIVFLNPARKKIYPFMITMEVNYLYFI